MLKSLWQFINYWYFRYLLVSELYMVEKWERLMIYIVFFIVFCLLSLFNNFVVLQAMTLVLKNKEEIFLYNPLEKLLNSFG